MKKRGQIISEAFVYALTIVIVGVILVMGYKYISSSKKIMDRGELLQFQNKLVFDINSVGKDFGRLKKVSYSIPRNLEEVCFVDLSKKDKIISSKIISFYPLIKDSLNSDLGRNIFFVGSTDIQSFYADNMVLEHYPFMNCFHKKNDKVRIGIEGLGSGKVKIVADFITRVKINKDDRTILQSADEIITIEVAKNTQVNVNEITIEMIEPTSDEAKGGASDLYKFGPVGATFNPPAELRIKYNPAIIGTECPTQLPFHLISETGNEKITILSKSIDCKSKVVFFDIDKFI